MNRIPAVKNSLSLLFGLLISCDHGIAPVEKEEPAPVSGITGTIYYHNWPDTVINLKIIAFKEFPPQNIFEEIQTGRAVAYPPELEVSLPKFVDSSSYQLRLEPGVFEYIVVAEQRGGLFDWRAVGHHDTTITDSMPTSVTVLADSFLTGIDVTVDFNHLPIQPF